ncbi:MULTISPECIES: DUF943 family protein [Erwinia]|uniref:DUF943 family protein n=1 Tax=Erwinia TaxID=551 RepID=UPI001438261F|nr:MULTISPECIES: DUF943 family protein [Erwinia]NKG31075.1 DUF943 family protein [Erwinia rhapontici]NNS08337.1 DUF943 family protein [Erwinia sp. JH02]
MLNNSKKRKFMVLIIMIIGGYILWLWCRPVRIIAVHQSGSYSIVLVKNYPFTDAGKMEWWLKNKEMVKETYNIPKLDKQGRYHVILWDFDDGYKELDKYDRLCFEDMKPPVNCVDKNSLMIISRDKYNVTKFIGDDGVYILQDNGLIVKRKSD